MVRPLALALEAGGDGAVAARLFLEAQFGQARVAVHEVAGDERHLGDELPPVLVLLGVAPLRRVPVLTLLEVLADPLVGLLVLLGIVDALVDAARELAHVDVLVAHAQVGAEEVGVHDGAGDTHGDRAHGQVSLALHLSDGQAGGRVVEEAGAHVLGDRGVVSVLHVLAVDAEGGDADLGVAGQGGGQVHGAGTLGAVEAPDRVRHCRVHVRGLGAVAPARGHRHGQTHVVRAELRRAGLRLVDAADRGVGDDDLDRGAIRVAQVGRKEVGDRLRHVHGLLFERLTHALAAAINRGADSDAGVFSHYSFIPHEDVDVGARGRSPPRILGFSECRVRRSRPDRSGRDLRRATGSACASPAPASCPIGLVSHSYRLALMASVSMFDLSYQAKPESMTVGSSPPLRAATAAFTV